ncbi:DoxX family protein [Actinomycetospora straminea]|uniref:DoxX family protein n=1 Tax=Actinomycetospora straminea TaxID=663607 RepID=A0ABP9ESU3_9PSEU|nr:DoxX family protein [Actinomycetospora straminea]MDD7931464.1 DoxX family protein [Actinomycetospora straminea]
MTPVIGFAAAIVVIFAGLGLVKVLALAPARALATEAGFSVDAYRRIGALELAGAVGVALGPAVPVLGVLAGTGLLLLLAGAVVTHLRHRDGVRRIAPAVVCAVLVAGYLAALGQAVS